MDIISAFVLAFVLSGAASLLIAVVPLVFVSTVDFFQGLYNRLFSK